MRVRRGLKSLDPTNLSFPEDIKICVNNTLCPYYRGLWNECKKLWNNKKIYSCFTASGTVSIKHTENGPYKSITHVNNLRVLFPEEQISVSLVV